MAPRLKVFVTSDGLTDYVVAASSKPKALAAWGSHQDLFKTGLAHETDDPALVTAATAQPGEVLRRAAGGRAKLASIKPSRPAGRGPAGPSKAALKKVADVEAKLADVDAAHAAQLAALDIQRARVEAAYHARRTRLEHALTAARKALNSSASA